MKKINFFVFLFCIICTNCLGQIWIEDFDGSNTTNPISTSTQCSSNGNSYFGIVCADGGGCPIEISPTNSALYGPLMG